MITEHDCGTEEGLRMTPLIEGGDVVVPLAGRILGRVVAQNVTKPGTDEVVLEAGTLIDERLAEQIEGWGVDEVMVRSPITCEFVMVCARIVTAVTSVVGTWLTSVRLSVLFCSVNR